MTVLSCKISLVLFFLCIIKVSLAIINGTVAVEEIDVNGRKIRPSYSEKYPFMVELLRRNLHSCGGALIRSNAVITAARCISLSKALPNIKKFTLLAGNQIIEEDYDTFEQRRTVEKVVLAEEWPLNQAADYALLKPSKDFKLTSWVNIISLDFEWTDSYTYGRQFGWGYTEKKRYSSVLRYSDTYVEESHFCFDPNMKIPGKVCLNEETGYPCYGDFGGPVIVDLGDDNSSYALVSLISHNPGAAFPGITKISKISCENEKYSIGVNVSYFRNNIDQIVENDFNANL